MLAKVKTIMRSRESLLVFSTLAALGTWIYSRVWMVNPAILGDEYLYSMNARKALPWDPSPAGDFSNYLFNFVYQSTSLCGEAFYTCGKLLNIFFFLAFLITLYLVAKRFLPFWGTLGFLIAAGLSPLSVYTSMFLPESMYMFFMGLLLLSVLRATNEFSWRNWALVGITIGVASLVKPHAWLSAIAVGLTLLIVGIGNRDLRLFPTLKSLGALIAGAALSRIFLGFIIAGPKALGFFGQYIGENTINQVLVPQQSSSGDAVDGTSPLGGVFLLFWPQLTTHIYVISALMAISIAGLLLSILKIVKTRRLDQVSAFALFAFVWLFSLMLEIVIFTGWVTGTGDDHTTRVLLRYYEFLFVIVPLAAISVFTKKQAEGINVWVRWVTALVLLLLVTPAFTGYFSNLTIQIADAPTLAGLVVNADVFNAVAVVGFIALIVLATFPKFVPWTFVFLLPVSMVGTGWQIQDQYQGFRGTLSIADKAGMYLRDNFSPDEIDKTWVLASSRFDATNIALWADSKEITYELVLPNTPLSISDVPEGKQLILSTVEIDASELIEVDLDQEGFRIYRVR